MLFSPKIHCRVGCEVGLRGAAFDLVAERVLPLVGVGQKCIVEQEHAAREQAARQRERKNQPIEADAAGLEGDHLVVLGEHGQRYERGHQRRQRRELIDHERNEKAEIVDHRESGDVIPRDVAEQIEQRESVEDQQKAASRTKK